MSTGPELSHTEGPHSPVTYFPGTTQMEALAVSGRLPFAGPPSLGDVAGAVQGFSGHRVGSKGHLCPLC